MIPVSVINAASLQVALHQVSVLRLRGYFRGATADRWLMLFNANSVPADGAVPLIAPIPLPQTSPFFAEFEIGALWFSLGCYACVSTTENTKTLSTDTMDLTVELDAPEANTSVSYAGDLTSAVTGLQVWSEADGATARKALISLEVDGTNLTGATQYIQIFAADTVNTGDKPIIMFPIAAGAVLTGEQKLNFGVTGRDILSQDSVTPFTNRRGCTVKISSTNATFTACNGTACIRAEYNTHA